MTDFRIFPGSQNWPVEMIERHNQIVAETHDKKVAMVRRIYDQEQEIKHLRAWLDRLAACEADYRSAHDLCGDGSREAGRAWDLMRRAGDKAREIVLSVSETVQKGEK